MHTTYEISSLEDDLKVIGLMPKKEETKKEEAPKPEEKPEEKPVIQK